jgi:2'-5' RNA ligase
VIGNGIALIPDQTGLRELVRLQHATRAIEPLQPILSEAEYLPHITLLQGNSMLPLGSVDLLETLATTISTMRLQLFVAAVSYVQRGWYFLDIEPIQQLRHLHDIAFRACKDCLIPPSITESTAVDGYTSSHMDNFLKFGYRYIGDDYRPHVTIGRTEDKHISRNDVELRAALSAVVERLHFSISSISAYRMGVNGGHLETLAGVSVAK